ncbi:MAG: DUF2834 domain-containing protein [Pseudomonadota bacterium]
MRRPAPLTAPPLRRASRARWLYLILALLGLAFPVRRYTVWLLENGFELKAMAGAMTANTLSAGLSSTVFIVTVATLVFIVVECRARRDMNALICVPLTMLFGVAFGLPFYLYLRQRQRD